MLYASVVDGTNVATLSCPKCGEQDVQLRLFGDPGEIGWGTIWSAGCEHGLWLSRIRVPATLPDHTFPANDEVAAAAVPLLAGPSH